MASKDAERSMKYAKENLKRVPLNIRIDYFTEVLKKIPDATGVSIQGFIKAAITEKIRRDGLDLPIDQYKP